VHVHLKDQGVADLAAPESTKGTSELTEVPLVPSSEGTELPIRGAVGTPDSVLQGPEDTTVVHPPVKEESARTRRIRERDERIGWVRGLPKSASEALKTAMAWRAEIEGTGIRQTDIASRERISRARVTQIMSLLSLSDDLKAMLLEGHAEVEEWSIRRALHEVG